MTKLLLVSAAIMLLTAGCNKNSIYESNDPKSDNPDGLIEHISPPVAKLDMTGWKTYSDDHISFKYPEEFGLGVDRSLGYPIEISLGRKQDIVITPIGIAYRPDTFSSSIDNYYKDLNNSPAPKYSLTTLDPRDTAYVFNQSQENSQTSYIVFAKGFAYTITATRSNTAEDYQHILDVFQTILSTIQFK